MPDYAPLFGLDTASVDDQAAINYRYAKSVFKASSHRLNSNSYVASSFLIAASLQTLTNIRLAQRAFIQSAVIFRRDNNSFWKIVAVCGSTFFKRRPIVESKRHRSKKHQLSPDDDFARLILTFFNLLVLKDSNLESLKEYRSDVYVGRLRLPMRLYVDAFTSINSLQIQQAILPDELKSLLKRMTENAKPLWPDFSSGVMPYVNFIPVEPELLAFNICIIYAINNMNIATDDVLNQLPDDLMVRNVFRIANDIVRATVI